MMKRTRHSSNDQSELQAITSRLAFYDAILSRSRLASKLGYQYGTSRNLYQALGYKLSPTYEDFATYYARIGMAKAVINRPIRKTWRGLVRIREKNSGEESKFEKAWKDLDKKLKLKSKFIRLDKLACLGGYAVLMLGFDDTPNDQSFAQPVNANGKRKLLYVKPLAENKAGIETWEENVRNIRYSKPLIYNLTLDGPNSSSSKTLRVHHTRILHVTSELLESDVNGIPLLESIYNDLDNLQKILGGDAEMYWRGARPGYQGIVDPDFQLTPEMKDDLKSQLDEYEHNLRRFLVNTGVEYKSLAQQVSDPRPHVLVQVQMISAATGFPMRILLGSERGELASSEDTQHWIDIIEERRDEHAAPNIIEPFIERCLEYGVLPEPKNDYSIVWGDLRSKNPKDKAETGRIRATALKEYSIAPAAPIILDPDSFLEFGLGLTEDEIEIVRERRMAGVTEEMKEMEELRQTMRIEDRRSGGGSGEGGSGEE